MYSSTVYDDSMQKYMNCKGGCIASMGPDQPAEVADGAPKQLVYSIYFPTLN